jgi:hypothetical protein
MARRSATAEWDASAAPPTEVKAGRNAGRQFAAPTKTAQAAEKRAVRQAQVATETRTAVRRRVGWERSSEGQERTRDVVDYATEQHNRIARERPELGLTPQKRLNLSHRQAYEHYGFGEHDIGPTMHDVQLPGMEDPHALPRPKRWEEHTEAERADIAARVKHKTGQTTESMSRHFGSQLDQGHLRARQAGAAEPYAQSFYLPHGEAAQRLRTTSRRHDVPLGLVAATNADTSPQMKFRYVTKKGEVSFPNADQAEHVIKSIKAGRDPNRLTKKGLTGMARTGFDTNFRKAARRAHQVIRRGKSVSETYMGSGTGSGFGPKTAAYHNAWLTGHPQFVVSDVHTGGGGFLPHFSTEKPLQRDEEGNVKLRSSGTQARAKSEREMGVEITGFHAMADYAARHAMAQRGLSRIPQAQATQWGEEQLRRGEKAKDPRVASAFPTQEQAHPTVGHPVQFGHHQGRLF